MASYSEAQAAVVAYIRAGFTALTVYANPTTDLTAADEVAGWVELEWRPGQRGLEGGRLGPTQTWYDTPFDFTARIMIPRLAGGDEAAWATAWAAAVAIEALLVDTHIGDVYIQSARPSPMDLEEGDSHAQIDLLCYGFLESWSEAPTVSSLGGIGTPSQVYPGALGPGLARGNWVGVEAGPLWRKVAAQEGEPKCLGVVSRPPDGSFIVTSAGSVEMPDHGWPVGALWLSQVTPGAVTSTEPVSGIARMVGFVTGPNEVIVLQLPEVLK